jgi:putative spermidine/putrescine transport system permease protein
MSASSDAGSVQPELLVPPVPTPTPRVDGPGRASQFLAWIGVVPFFTFALLFLILPTGFLMVGAFQDSQGHFTLANFRDLLQPTVLDAYWISFKVSAASSLGGAVIGSLLAWAAVQGKLPGWIRPTLMTFSGVASNFAGVPLAFAFICTLGRVGLVTVLLKKYLGFNLDGLKREWREACDCLGGTSYQYWRYVALPVLWPSVLGAALLLFANSFGAVATAYALTGSSLNIVTILLYAQIRGDVMHNQNLGYALALGMVLVTGLSNGGYIWLRSRAERGRR